MHSRYLYILLLALIISACSSRKKAGTYTRIPGSTNGPVRKDGKAPARQGDKAPATRSYGRSLSTVSYIQLYHNLAIKEMKRTGIPASVTLAQGILESGNGNSRLARQANNHFGIKCTSDWKGRKTYKDDDRRNDCFRMYPSVEDSFRDHSEFLQRNRYSFLFDLKPHDYKGWARGLKRAGYATNPRYANLLIDLIERYELHQFDRMNVPEEEPLLAKNQPARTQQEETEPSAEQPVRDPSAEMPEEETEQPAESLPQGPSGETPEEEAEPDEPFVTAYMYTVRQGDTLYSVSKRFNISLEDLKQWNDLPDNQISIGQQLKVSR